MFCSCQGLACFWSWANRKMYAKDCKYKFYFQIEELQSLSKELRTQMLEIALLGLFEKYVISSMTCDLFKAYLSLLLYWRILKCKHFIKVDNILCCAIYTLSVPTVRGLYSQSRSLKTSIPIVKFTSYTMFGFKVNENSTLALNMSSIISNYLGNLTTQNVSKDA